MNKKGFTLIELIAVLVVLSILISASVMLFINIRKNILEKEYNNLVLYLETKASEYAEETSITTINVEDLIKEGKVKSDDETDIYDPRDNKSMNCFIIKSNFENGKYNSTLMEDLGKDENGKCNEYEVTTDYEVCKFLNGQCIKFDDTTWFNSAVTLGIMHRGSLLTEQNTTYNWTSNTGFSSNEATISVDGNLLNSRYKCEVKGKSNNGEDLVGTATKGIKIDKEAPIINEIKYNTNWSVNKKIEIMASDGIGSGIDGYAIVKENEMCLNYNKNKEITINSNGKYKVCVKDKAGNKTERKIEITSIDDAGPSIVAKSSSNEIKMGTNNKTSSYFIVTYSISGGTLSCTPEATGYLAVGTYTLKCIATGGNGKTADATTELKVIPLTPSTPTIITKLESSSGQIYNGTWTNKSIYIEINPGSVNDVVTKFEYKIGNGNWITASGTIDGNKGSFVYSSEIDNTIYVRNCYQNKCSSPSNGKTLKIDKTVPTCKLTANSSKISFGQKSTDVQKSGITKNKTADYTNATVNISTGKFYGYVIDKAGNTGSCNIEIIETSSSRSCSETCTEGTEVCDLVCYYNASSSEIARKSCNRGAYEPTWKTCYSAYYSSCPSTFPIVDRSASRCYTTGGGCTTSCSTTYYCKSGYTKINSSYCYK